MSNNKNLKKVKIAISGKSGCGNTTVSRMIADALELCFINFTFRSLAQEKGLSLNEVINLAAKDDSWDIEVDTRQVKMAREAEGCVLGSRLAIWMLTEADIKVFLTASAETRVRRIHSREKNSALEEIANFTAFIDKQDHERYLKIYEIDNDDYSFADMIVNTDELSAQEITEKVIAEVKKKLALAC